jgi:regulator of replication initiation timing
MCNCNDYSSIEDICKPIDKTWQNCSQKLRYTKYMLSNDMWPDNTKIDGNGLRIVDLREYCDHIAKRFVLEFSDVRKVLSSMRQDELDEHGEVILGELDLDKIQHTIEISDFYVLSKILYNLTRKQLESLRSIPILNGFIEEALGHYDDALKIFHTDVLKYKKLTGYLSYLYGNNVLVADHDNKSFEYTLEFYDTIDELDSYISSLKRDDHYEHKQLVTFVRFAFACKEQNRLLMIENEQLRERITELEYAPGGVGYQKTKEHFEKLVKL